jgi:hypothetical protein
MRNRKYMDDYNYHDWTEFMVEKPEQKPVGPHFGAILFGTRTEHIPAYDAYDTPSSSQVPMVTYFAFPDQETLKAWALRAAKDKKQFFFFEVKKVGQAELKINVDLEV